MGDRLVEEFDRQLMAICSCDAKGHCDCAYVELKDMLCLCEKIKELEHPQCDCEVCKKTKEAVLKIARESIKGTFKMDIL